MEVRHGFIHEIFRDFWIDLEIVKSCKTQRKYMPNPFGAENTQPFNRIIT